MAAPDAEPSAPVSDEELVEAILRGDQRAFDALYELGRGNLRATDLLALAALDAVTAATP